MSDEITKLESIRPAGFAVVRLPALPHVALISVAPNDCVGTTSERLKVSVERIRRAFRQPELLAALAVASSSIQERVAIWLQDESEARSDHKLALSLYKYYARMCSRPTPFGLFSSTVFGEIARSKSVDGVLEVSDVEIDRHSRLDTTFVRSLFREAMQHQEFRTASTYVTNPTLYRCGRFWRYYEPLYDIKSDQNKFLLSEVEATPELDVLVEACAKEATPFEALVSILLKFDNGIEIGDATTFCAELVANGVLFSTFEPAVIGDDPLSRLANSVLPFKELRDLSAKLEWLRTQMTRISKAAPKDLVDELAVLRQTISSRTATKSLVDKYVQIDQVGHCSPLPLDRNTLANVAQMLASVSRCTPTHIHPIEHFIANFSSKFEYQEIPLLEALDADLGLWNGTFPPESSLKRNNSKLSSLLFEKYQDCLRRGGRRINLTLSDLESSRVDSASPLPSTFSATLAFSRNESGRAQIRVLSAFGPTGANLLARFCSYSPAMAAATRSLFEAEQTQQADALLAEVVHWPEDRTGNLLLRPCLRSTEISVLGHSCSDAYKIPANRLLISISKGRIVLRDKGSGRRIIPRLSTAHDFSGGAVPLYSFLGMYQLHEALLRPFMWPVDFRNAFWLPEVTIGEFVVAPERWTGVPQSLKECLQKCSGDIDLVEWTGKLKMQLGLPRFVEKLEGEDRTVFDLENPLAALFIAKELRQGKALDLSRADEPGQPLLTRGGIPYAHEVVIPFVVADTKKSVNDIENVSYEAQQGTLQAIHSVNSPSREIVMPGDGVIFYKIYCSPKLAERILVTLVAPIAKKLLSTGQIESWFFIRYRDPRFHLRVRFFIRSQDAAGEVLKAFFPLRDAFADNHIIEISVATYEPEVFRYGGSRDSMRAIESFFFRDTESAVEILSEVAFSKESERLLIAAYCLRGLASDFGVPPAEQARFFRMLYRSMLEQNSAVREARSHLEIKARDVALRFSEFLNRRSSELDSRPDTEKIIEIYRRRSVVTCEAITTMVDLEKSGRLNRPLQEVVSSLCHMAINRLADSADANLFEATSYSLLHRILDRQAHAR